MVRESHGSTTHTCLTCYNGGIFIEELREDFWACAHGKMCKQRGVQGTESSII